jgi:flagellar hook protein FlgE
MSISSAMQTGVSGLFANSISVGRISENIANANTDGYKRRFAQMVTTTATGSGGDAPSGVEAVAAADVTRGGTLTSTTSATDLAVNGNGFFIVSPAPNDPVASHYLLTRAGSFTPDANGNLVNAAGYFLAGYQYQADGTLGAVDRNGFSGMTTVNVSDASIPPSATTSVSVQGNLPSQQAGLATPGAPFTSSTNFFSPLGASHRLQFSWQPTSTASTWTVTISDDSGTTYGSVDVTFNDSGANAGSPASYSNVVSSAAAPAGFAFDPTTGTATLTINNGTTPQTLDVKLGAPNSTSGITQFAGDFTPQTFGKDGSAASSLSRVEVDSNGNLIGVFDNGQRKSLYQIPLGNVTNPDGLTPVNGNAYQLSRDSGAYNNQQANTGAVGSVASKSLESSNVDIAQELSDLIRVQRAYSTDAKIVTTMDQMLNVTTQLKT